METITERERHTMLTRLDELMGPEVAAIVVRHLPPRGWGDVATKHDLVQLEDRITHRFDAMLTREVSGVRGEIAALRGALRSEIADQRDDFRTELHTEIRTMTRTYILGNVGLVVSVAGLAFGAARLF